MADELITIGVLARASGLTASALRFYDDCGLLVPARVDPLTGYRYYTEAQRERAGLIRRLRAIDVPLEVIADILSGAGGRAEQLLDDHIDELRRRAREAARVAVAIKQELRAVGDAVTLPAGVLAAAFEQVRAAAAADREIPVLAGILLESSANSLTLTATDRYRLSTRTVVPRDRRGQDWSLVVDAEGLSPVLDWLRDADDVVATPTGHGLLLTGDGTEYRCPAIDEPFPDYRAMLSELTPVRTRVTTARTPLLTFLENTTATVGFEIGPTGLTVYDHYRREQLPAQVIGPAIVLFFTITNLLPAVHTALGPDLMLDISAPDHPIVVRSATDGDLTTLVMPIRLATLERTASNDHR